MAINIEKFKNKLFAQKLELETTITQAIDAAKPVELDQTVVGRVSRIDAIQQQEMTLAAQRRRVEQVQKTEAALQRIESGDFGYCVKCGEGIAEKRLDLDPAISTCIGCAQNL